MSNNESPISSSLVKSIHVFIISWKGMHSNASNIASQVGEACNKLTIVYSDPDPHYQFDEKFRTVRRPNDLFWGDKFSACLQVFDEDLMLVIHADCSCSDWRALVVRCHEDMMRRPTIGVWAPLIDWTPYSPKITGPSSIRVDPVITMEPRGGARWACGQVACRPVHMSTGRCLP